MSNNNEVITFLLTLYEKILIPIIIPILAAYLPFKLNKIEEEKKQLQQRLKEINTNGYHTEE